MQHSSRKETSSAGGREHVPENCSLKIYLKATYDKKKKTKELLTATRHWKLLGQKFRILNSVLINKIPGLTKDQIGNLGN